MKIDEFKRKFGRLKGGRNVRYSVYILYGTTV
jgi:hypothetical protein